MKKDIYRLDQLRISPSSVKHYFECSGSWKRRYLDNVPIPKTGKTAAVMGTCFHSMMELYDQKKLLNDAEVKRLIKQVIRASREVDINLVDLAKFQNELLELFEIGKEMSLKWKEFKVVHLEQGIEFPFDFDLSVIKEPVVLPKKFTVYGKIDKLLKAPKFSSPIVFDWKTSSKLKTEEELNRDIQLTMYIGLVARKFKVPVEDVMACLVFPKFNAVVWTDRTKQEVDEFWSNELFHFTKGVVSGNFFDRRCDRCNYCDYRKVCSAW